MVDGGGNLGKGILESQNPLEAKGFSERLWQIGNATPKLNTYGNQAGGNPWQPFCSAVDTLFWRAPDAPKGPGVQQAIMTVWWNNTGIQDRGFSLISLKHLPVGAPGGPWYSQKEGQEDQGEVNKKLSCLLRALGARGLVRALKALYEAPKGFIGTWMAL